MKKHVSKLVLLIISLWLINLNTQAQNYYMTQPEGFAAGVTGGGTPTSSNTVTVTSESEFKSAVEGSKSVILVKGTITFSAMYKISFSNKTILGLPGATLVNNNTPSNTGILYLSGGSNIIIRNLIFVGPPAYDVDGNDNLSIKGASKVWVDHCEFRDGIDDCFDITGSSDNVTVSWSKITHLKAPKAGGSGGADDHRYANLIGGGETDYPSDGGYSITWQYCWWADGNKDRMVRGRNTDLHFISCYWNSSVASHYISLTSGSKGSKAYCENGVFVGSTPPMTLDKSGSFNCQIVNSINGSGGAVNNSNIKLTNSAVNPATQKAPGYSYSSLPASQVVAAVTNSSCGAGATLQVSTSGVISSSCSSSTTIAVTGVTVSPTTASIAVGGTSQLTATVSPSNATNKNVTWTSSNTSVATVSSSGLITGVAAGSATITVTTADGGKTATCAVTVTTSSVAVTGVTVSPTTASITVGGTSQLTATVSPSNATNKNVTWTSSNTSVATVSSSGLVSGVAAGSATITVKTSDGSKTATCAVTVTSGGTTVATIYEAENGTMISAGVESTYTGYSGTGYVNTSNKVGSGIEWSVTAPAAGTYYINFRYANKSTDMPGDVYINGTKVGTVALSNTGSLNTYANSAALTVTLVSGSNKIKILSTTSVGLPNMDYLYVSSSALKAAVLANGSQKSNNSNMLIAPNYIRESANITFELTEASHVKIAVYNMRGNKVAEISNQNYEAGSHNLRLERASLSSGTYIVRMIVNNKVQTAKIVVR